jgi:Asp-tRNA(Asn)/Glu-tRNA(Gln) amidotransferase A subunit family amidase
MPNTPTLATLADDLECGRASARKLVDECLAKIADASGEGARAFIHVDAEAAIEAAEAMDRLREVKAAPSRFAGIPVSIKDLFDIRGQVTRAGSRALDDSPPAEADAPAVARRRRAGFVVIGRTNMTGVAYSGSASIHITARRRARGIARPATCPVGRRRVLRFPSSTAWRMAGSAPTPAAPAGYRRPITASSASSRRSAGCR